MPDTGNPQPATQADAQAPPATRSDCISLRFIHDTFASIAWAVVVRSLGRR